MRRVIFIVACFCCAAQAPGAILLVGGGGYAGIQAAIVDANNGDIIVVSPGTYQENIDFLGKSITVCSMNPDDPCVVAATIIDGSSPADTNFASVVTFKNAEDNNSVLSGFTITGGTGSWLVVSWENNGPLWNRCGGGAVCYNMSAPTIIKNVFVDNTAGQGGGVYIYGDPVNPEEASDPAYHISPLIIDNTFTDNHAILEHGFSPPDSNYPADDHGDGGGIVAFQGCDAVITGNVIAGNTADYYGGGIHLRQWSNGVIEDNKVLGNRAILGGGLHITYTSSPDIRGNLIAGNKAGLFGGGGLYIYNESSPLVEQNEITDNNCINGAGIAVYYESNPVIRNNLIHKNHRGAGVRVRGGSCPFIRHNTITGNSARYYSGGIDCTENSSPEIVNNIITSNGSGYGIYVDELSGPSIRYNNVCNHSLGSYGPGISDQTGLNGNISSAPGFVDAAGNDYHLNPDSVCIDAGDPNFSGETATDYDNNSRKMGRFTDIGAYEVWPVWNESCSEGYTTIQEAIDDSNDGDEIVVTAGRYYENLNFNGRNVTVRSVRPNDPAVVEATIIDGNDAGTVVLFESAEDANCVLSGFTICNGNEPDGFGGGIRIRNYSGPTICNNVITHNRAKQGAGISMYHSFSRVFNNRVLNNYGPGLSQGGGIVMIDCLEEPNAVVANNIIVGNTAYYAGGIRIRNCTAQVVNNLVAYNRGRWEGIGVYAHGEMIENCIVWGNINISPYGTGSALYQCEAAYCCVDQELVGGGNISEDPNLVAAGSWDDNGTPEDYSDDYFIYGNYHLRLGSACIDAGDSNLPPAWLSIDVDEETRVFSGRVDIGPDEVVTNAMDFNTNGIVDYNDLEVVIGEWLSEGEGLAGDLSGDGFVDLSDFSIFAEQWLWRGGWYE